MSCTGNERRGALGEADEVLVVGVNVGKLVVDEQHNVVLRGALALADLRRHRVVDLLAQTRVPVALRAQPPDLMHSLMFECALCPLATRVGHGRVRL